jgi:hypothetical protein
VAGYERGRCASLLFARAVYEGAPFHPVCNLSVARREEILRFGGPGRAIAILTLKELARKKNDESEKNPFPFTKIARVKLEIIGELSSKKICQPLANYMVRFPPFLVGDIDAADNKYWLFSVAKIGSSAASLIDVEKMHPTHLARERQFDRTNLQCT